MWATISAIVDYPFITGRSTADSYKTGELLVAALKNGLKNMAGKYKF